MIVGPPVPQSFGTPASLQFVGLSFTAQQPSFYWSKDGAALSAGSHYQSAGTASLGISGFGPADAGLYQVVVSNAYGMATSAPVQVVVHCVDQAGLAPQSPYLDWAAAATNIQDAIDAAAAGDFVVVTNGVYTSGGRVMEGTLTNRIALTKPLTVMSVNGPFCTVVNGGPIYSSPGPAAVRCAWLTNGASLLGFSLENGATPISLSAGIGNGAGVWAASTNAWIINCLITHNSAYGQGGGVYQGTLVNCSVQFNFSLAGNGGGVYQGILVNCNVFDNSASQGGGVYQCSARNCIIFYNDAVFGANWYVPHGATDILYTCTSPLPPGPGNTSLDPQMIDGFRLKPTSPCRGAGSAAYVSGNDLDGELWNTPPPMGCDEVWESALNGPLYFTRLTNTGTLIAGMRVFFFGDFIGKASRLDWDFGDGTVQTNSETPCGPHGFTNGGTYTVTCTVYNSDYPSGVSTNGQFAIQPLLVPFLSAPVVASNAFSVNITGQNGIYYELQASTNLTPPITWFSVTSGPALNNGSLTLTDRNPSNDARFYRVSIPGWTFQ